jgi:hypothetical protein
MMKFLEKLPSQEASATPLATARYSASALDRETVGWLGRPGNKASSKKDSIAHGGVAGVGAAGPVGVGVHDELCWSRSGNNQTIAERALEVAKNALGSH